MDHIAGKHNLDIANLLFPGWDHQRAMKFMDDKEAVYRRYSYLTITLVINCWDWVICGFTDKQSNFDRIQYSNQLTLDVEGLSFFSVVKFR